MTGKLIEINLFGACLVRGTGADAFQITGSKHKALFALLATAPFGRRTRSFLQETLWGSAWHDGGRQSLRRALSDVRGIMGDAADDILKTTNAELTLDLTKVEFIGRPGAGTLLEGLNIREQAFNRWLDGMRADPSQLDGLFSLRSQVPEKSVMPVVAAIPFQTVLGDQDQATLGDWLASEISRSLSRSNMLSVISHLSSRRVASEVIDVDSLRERLGADFCIAGSLRPDGSNVLLDADFIDVRSGQIVWTRRFTGSVGDFIGRDAPGVAHIVRRVGASIADDAIRHVNARELTSIDDHRLLTSAVGLMHQPTLRDFAKSRELLQEALRRAPRVAEAHAWLGKWYVLSVFNGWATSPQVDTNHAIDATARALDIDPDNAFALTVDGFAHNNLLKRIDIAASRYNEALRYNPNEALSWLLKGMLHAFTDKADDAVDSVEKARLLSPMDPFGYYFDSLSASAYLSAGEYSRALDFARRSISTNNRHLSTLRAMITALYFLGRMEDAKKAGEELMRRQPNCSVAQYLREHPAADYQLGKNVAEALTAAGIP